MNKAVRIGAIVLGAILAAALVIFIFFPGLPTYAYVKFKYKNIDKTAGKQYFISAQKRKGRYNGDKEQRGLSEEGKGNARRIRSVGRL